MLLSKLQKQILRRNETKAEDLNATIIKALENKLEEHRESRAIPEKATLGAEKVASGNRSI